MHFGVKEYTDHIIAYSVEVTSMDRGTGKVYGNIYEIDLREHANHVMNEAVPPQDVTMVFDSGVRRTIGYEEFKHGTGNPDNPVSHTCLSPRTKPPFKQCFLKTVPSVRRGGENRSHRHKSTSGESP